MGPYHSPEPPEPPPPKALRHDLFIAVLFPAGLISGIILLFAFWTTDRLVIPGYDERGGDKDVKLLDVRIGSTEHISRHVWGAGFLVAFTAAGGLAGYLAGKVFGRLTHWGT